MFTQRRLLFRPDEPALEDQPVPLSEPQPNPEPEPQAEPQAEVEVNLESAMQGEVSKLRRSLATANRRIRKLQQEGTEPAVHNDPPPTPASHVESFDVESFFTKGIL